MSEFGKNIKQLLPKASDNYARNDTSSSDLDSHLTDLRAEFDVVFENPTTTKILYGPRNQFKRLYTGADPWNKGTIGWKDGMLQSIEPGVHIIGGKSNSVYRANVLGGITDDLFLSSFYYLDTKTKIPYWINASIYPAVYYPISQYKTVPYFVLNSNYLGDPAHNYAPGDSTDLRNFTTIIEAGDVVHHYWLKDYYETEGIHGTDYNNGALYKGQMLDVESDSIKYNTSSINTSSVQRISPSLPSITLEFSMGATTFTSSANAGDWTTGVNTTACWVGIFLLNQPVLQIQYPTPIPEIDITQYHEQTDGFVAFLNFSVLNSGFTSYATEEFPKIEDRAMPVDARLYCGRLDGITTKRTWKKCANLDEYYHYFDDISGDGLGDLKFVTNVDTDTIPGCDKTFTNGGIVNPTINYEGPIRNELRLEFGHTYDESGNIGSKYIILVYLNGVLMEKMVTSRVSGLGDPGASLGWWNQNHLIPGILVNAPESMIKIHSFKIDVD